MAKARNRKTGEIITGKLDLVDGKAVIVLENGIVSNRMINRFKEVDGDYK